jgi:hypothetical protein
VLSVIAEAPLVLIIDLHLGMWSVVYVAKAQWDRAYGVALTLLYKSKQLLRIVRERTIIGDVICLRLCGAPECF